MRARHEPDRIGGRPLLIAIAGIVALVAVTLGAMAFLLRGLTRATRDVDIPRSVIAGETVRADTPMLQPSVGHDRKDADDLAMLRASENSVFLDLGWAIDLQTGRARPPAAVVERVIAASRRRTAATNPTPLPATWPEMRR